MKRKTNRCGTEERKQKYAKNIVSWSLTKDQKQYNGTKSLVQMVLKQMDINKPKKKINKSRYRPCILPPYLFKVDHRSKCNCKTTKLLEVKRKPR